MESSHQSLEGEVEECTQVDTAGQSLRRHMLHDRGMGCMLGISTLQAIVLFVERLWCLSINPDTLSSVPRRATHADTRNYLLAVGGSLLGVGINVVGAQ
jgi:hypothetical protein